MPDEMTLSLGINMETRKIVFSIQFNDMPLSDPDNDCHIAYDVESAMIVRDHLTAIIERLKQ